MQRDKAQREESSRGNYCMLNDSESAEFKYLDESLNDLWAGLLVCYFNTGGVIRNDVDPYVLTLGK